MGFIGSFNEFKKLNESKYHHWSDILLDACSDFEQNHPDGFPNCIMKLPKLQWNQTHILSCHTLKQMN